MDRLDVFDNIDRLVGIEMRLDGLPGGVMPRLYNVARGKGPPISFEAGKRLLDPGISRVALVTGVVAEQLPHGEIDGPIGSAVLAEALGCLGRAVTVIVPPDVSRAMSAIRKAIGGSFEIITDGDANPTKFDAAVAIERLGRNRVGQHHSILGGPLALDPVADVFIEGMNDAGRLTIGIGDGGNEIGFGAVYDEARAVVPRGKACGCPCDDGIVTSTATQLLYPVAVSDFGAYALAAAVGLLVDRPTILPRPSIVEAAMHAALAEGSLDGGTYQPGFVGDDGIPFETIAALLNVLQGIALQAYRRSPRHA
jgi:hypothetical protein